MNETAPSARERGLSRDVILRGAFDGHDVINLMQSLEHSKQTGALTFALEETRQVILFVDGRIVTATSNDLRDSLGSYLLARGACSSGDIQNALQLQKKKRMLIGGALIELGVVDRDQLSRALSGKTEEILYSLCERNEGEVAFAPSIVDPDSLHYCIDLSPADVLWRAESRRRHKNEILDELGGLAAIASPRPDFDRSTLGPFGCHVMQIVDGFRTLLAVARDAGVPQYWTLNEAHHLQKAGAIEMA